jgi:hypothetical protein
VKKSEFELFSQKTSNPCEEKIFWHAGAQNYKQQNWSSCFPELNSMLTKETWNWMRCAF